MSSVALIRFFALGLLLSGYSVPLQNAKAEGLSRVVPITSKNRNYPGIMFGGWGPHLRALMRNSKDELWFVTDAGPDVQHNEQLIYHRFDGARWSEAATLKQMSGIQQNVASVLCNDCVYSYGISVRAPRYIEECIFDTVRQEERACRPIEVDGKKLLLPPSCNYVGAALSPAGRKIVWWTTVGDNGAEGKWSYIYERSNLWVGPIVSTLGGYNDLGYVFAAFVKDDRLAIAGQLFKGAYPKGTYAVGCAEFTLGEKFEFRKNFFALDTTPENSGRSAADIVVLNGGTHVVAETQKGTLAYYYKDPAKSWIDCDKPVCVLTNVHRARFIATSKEFCLLTGSANGDALTVRATERSRVQGPVDWQKVQPVAIPVASRQFAEPAAIYVESCSYQTDPVKRLDFAIVGHYPEADSQILSVQLGP